jgi:hypothetical protein
MSEARNKCDTDDGPCACGAWHLKDGGAKMSDNKSQSTDHDTSSIPGHTESDCDDSSEVFDYYLRNVTLPPASLVFDLTDPEGERRLREMLDAPKVKLVLWELDNYLRDLIKYGDDKDGVELTTLEMVRKALWHFCDDHGIRLDEE